MYHSFTVGFSINQVQYTALVTPVSRSFRLYKISCICKKQPGNHAMISASLLLTNYSLFSRDHDCWKNAADFNTNEFIRVAGDAISAHEYTGHYNPIPTS